MAEEEKEIETTEESGEGEAKKDPRAKEHILGRLTIKTAVQELIDTIEKQEDVSLTPEAVERLTDKVLTIQEKILEAFDEIATDLRENSYSTEEKRDRIVKSILRAKPLIQKLSELQLKLDPEANLGAPLYQIYQQDVVAPREIQEQILAEKRAAEAESSDDGEG